MEENGNLENNDALRTRVFEIDPAKLVKLKKNARYMTAQQMKRLVENIKKDGALTSVPLVHKDNDEYIVLSGNHRVEAAVIAGLKDIMVMEVIGELTKDKLVALQLSHNSITGQDDPSILFELYADLDFDAKLYSGITDDVFAVKEIDLQSLGIGAPSYEEITIASLPDDATIFVKLLERFLKTSKRKAFVADLDTFDAIFDTIIRIKKVANIFNSAVAIRMMAELASERLDQLETDDRQIDMTEEV